jgi:hypothetical protein
MVPAAEGVYDVKQAKMTNCVNEQRALLIGQCSTEYHIITAVPATVALTSQRPINDATGSTCSVARTELPR